MEKKEAIKKGRKKYILLGLIAFIVIVLGSIICLQRIQKKDYQIEEISEFSYFKLYENEKYGVIDKKGNIIVEPKYEMIAIPNPSKAVFIGYFNYSSQEGEYETEVVNEKQEKLFTKYEQVLPLMFKEATSEVPYEKSVLAYKENGKYGIINFKGQKISSAIYDSIESLLYKEGCLLVKQNEKYGIITINGKKIIEIEYDSIYADGYYAEDTKYQEAGFVVGMKKTEGYRYGYINYQGEKLLEPEYNEIDRVTEIIEKGNIYLLTFRNGQAGLYQNTKQIVTHQYEEIEYNKINQVFILQKENKQGVISKEGKEILPIEYDLILISSNKINAQQEGSLYTFNMEGEKQEVADDMTILSTENENYLISINAEEKFGLIDKEGNVLIPNQYQYIEYAFDDYFIVIKNSKVGVIDKQQNVKIDFKYQVIQKIKNTKALQCILTQPYTIDIYNTEIQKVASMENAVLTEETDYIKLVSSNDRKYFNKMGNEIQNTELFLNHNLFSFEKEGKWGFINRAGEIIVEPIYDMVTELNSYGFAGIQQNEKWGVVDEAGNIIVNPTYEIDWQEPEFIGPYCKLNFGYGLEYYTKELIKE